MEGVALQADQAIKHISGSLLSQKHQRGPGQFGGRRKKTKERGEGEGQENRVKKKRSYSSSPSPFPQSVFSHEDGEGESLKLSCNSICVLERIRKSIPPFTRESQLTLCPVWSPYQPQAALWD